MKKFNIVLCLSSFMIFCSGNIMGYSPDENGKQSIDDSELERTHETTSHLGYFIVAGRMAAHAFGDGLTGLLSNCIDESWSKKTERIYNSLSSDEKKKYFDKAVSKRRVWSRVFKIQEDSKIVVNKNFIEEADGSFNREIYYEDKLSEVTVVEGQCAYFLLVNTDEVSSSITDSTVTEYVSVLSIVAEN